MIVVKRKKKRKRKESPSVLGFSSGFLPFNATRASECDKRQSTLPKPEHSSLSKWLFSSEGMIFCWISTIRFGFPIQRRDFLELVNFGICAESVFGLVSNYLLIEDVS